MYKARSIPRLKILSLNWVFCLAAFCVWAGLAYGADWKLHQSAGFRAYDRGDTAQAIEEFQAAIDTAQEQAASDESLAILHQNLATAYYSNGDYRRCSEIIDQWSQILARNGEAGWVAKHLPHRDRLVTFLQQMVGQPRAEESLTSEAKAPEEIQDLSPAAATRAHRAELTPSQVGVSGRYASHLESYRSEEDARTGWAKLKALYPALLTGTSLVIQRADLGERGEFYRVLADPSGDRERVQRLCGELASRGQYCAIMALE